ncbi:protein of unknown function [Paenibacillus algorifonticola]|uniref:DUF3427 domain-containing protein n=1 Tax=Paenibacillus algorifonticola TaxID=684063 RepID=A0A1I2CJ38_9BACL|nr:protein of unknown function [Paenibacillus algorifonticola]
MVEADLLDPFKFEQEDYLVKRLPALLSLNSRRLLKFLIAYLSGEKIVETDEEQLMLNLFYYTFYSSEPSKQGFTSMEQGIQFIISCQAFREEIIDILSYNEKHINFVDESNAFPYACPLDLHCRYSTNQILAAFGVWNEHKAPSFREGVKYLEDKGTDIFFITLNKSDKDFSPSTLYEDYAINERLFHWQTQSRISEETKTAQRYIHHKQLGHRIALFVREYKEEHNFTSPFMFLGEVEYVRHEGNKPMSFVWRLKKEMPPALVPAANKAIV